MTTIAQPLTYVDFTLAAPNATFTPYSDVSVPGRLIWTGATYGAPNAPAGGTLHVQGGSTTSPSQITPASGATILSGTRVQAEWSAVLDVTTGGTELNYGTLKFTTAKPLVATGSSDVRVHGVKITSGVTAPVPITVKTTQTGDAPKLTTADLTSETGLIVNGGTAYITGSPSPVKFTGPDEGGGDDTVEMRKGALVIDNGTTLEVPSTKEVWVRGGKLATRATYEGTQSPATIKAKALYTTESDLDNRTVIAISDTAYNPVGVTGHQFGQLVVEGKVYFWGGTYKPVVDGTGNGTPAAESTKADQWTASGWFDIDGTSGANNTGAKIAPSVINLPSGQTTPRQYRTWTVISSSTGISYNVAPKMSPVNEWGWQRTVDILKGQVYWLLP